MTDALDPTERRIIGVLIEKALTTPEYYPLTVNALVAGCNQKSNRQPVTDYREYEVEGALRSLAEKKWAGESDAGGRAVRWRHRVDDRLGLGPKEMAVLAELLLRGSQQPGELRARAGRMCALPTQEALQEVLDRLAAMSPPLVRRLPRVVGERADRYGQTLAEDGPDTAVAAPAAAAATTASAAAATSSAPASAAGPPSGATVDELRALRERVERLEAEVAALKAAMAGAARA